MKEVLNFSVSTCRSTTLGNNHHLETEEKMVKTWWAWCHENPRWQGWHETSSPADGANTYHISWHPHIESELDRNPTGVLNTSTWRRKVQRRESFTFCSRKVLLCRQGGEQVRDEQVTGRQTKKRRRQYPGRVQELHGKVQDYNCQHKLGLWLWDKPDPKQNCPSNACFLREERTLNLKQVPRIQTYVWGKKGWQGYNARCKQSCIWSQ